MQHIQVHFKPVLCCPNCTLNNVSSQNKVQCRKDYELNLPCEKGYLALEASPIHAYYPKHFSFIAIVGTNITESFWWSKYIRQNCN